MPPKRQLLEGSHAIALTIKAIEPEVVSAYPITPQTHIVEDLAKFKTDGNSKFSYVRAESEFAAASVILGASATGARVYSATSSQGLLLMAEVLFNIAGLRLPVVMTVANRAVSGPINIWNDQSDIMALRDCGAILLFAETHQEAIDQHVLAYKIAEMTSLPVFVNVDGFILTHSYESCLIPETKTIRRFLPKYRAKAGEFLNPKRPVTLGVLAGPEYYTSFRQSLAADLLASKKLIKDEYNRWKKIFPAGQKVKNQTCDNGLVEYYGAAKPKIVVVTLGTVAGTVKQVIDNKYPKTVGLIKLRCYRPFPGEAIKQLLHQPKKIIVLEKALGLGAQAPVYSDLAAALYGSGQKAVLKSEVRGLGGQDITEAEINKIIQHYEKD